MDRPSNDISHVAPPDTPSTGHLMPNSLNENNKKPSDQEPKVTNGGPNQEPGTALSCSDGAQTDVVSAGKQNECSGLDSTIHSNDSSKELLTTESNGNRMKPSEISDLSEVTAKMSNSKPAQSAVDDNPILNGDSMKSEENDNMEKGDVGNCSATKKDKLLIGGIPEPSKLTLGDSDSNAVSMVQDGGTMSPVSSEENKIGNTDEGDIQTEVLGNENRLKLKRNDDDNIRDVVQEQDVTDQMGNNGIDLQSEIGDGHKKESSNGKDVLSSPKEDQHVKIVPQKNNGIFHKIDNLISDVQKPKATNDPSCVLKSAMTQKTTELVKKTQVSKPDNFPLGKSMVARKTNISFINVNGRQITFADLQKFHRNFFQLIEKNKIPGACKKGTGIFPVQFKKQEETRAPCKRKTEKVQKEELAIKKIKTKRPVDFSPMTEGKTLALEAVRIAFNWNTPESAVEDALEQMIVDGDFLQDGENTVIIAALDLPGLRMAKQARSVLMKRKDATVRRTKVFVPGVYEKILSESYVPSYIHLARNGDGNTDDPLAPVEYKQSMIQRMINYIAIYDSPTTRFLFLCSPDSENLFYGAKFPLTDLAKKHFASDTKFVNPVQKRVIIQNMSDIKTGRVSKHVKRGTFHVVVAHTVSENEANVFTGDPSDVFEIDEPSIRTVISELESYMMTQPKEIVEMLKNNEDNIRPDNLIYIYRVLNHNLHLFPKVSFPFAVDQEYEMKYVFNPPNLTPREFGASIADVLHNGNISDNVLTKDYKSYKYTKGCVFIFNATLEGKRDPNQEAALACLAGLKLKKPIFNFVFLTFGMDENNSCEEPPVGAIITQHDVDHQDSNEALKYLECGKSADFWEWFRGGGNQLLGGTYGSKTHRFQLLILEGPRGDHKKMLEGLTNHFDESMASAPSDPLARQVSLAQELLRRFP